MTDIFDFLAREGPLFVQAPILVIGGAITVASLAWLGAWKLKGSIDEGVLAAARERMELAAERERNARDKFHRLEGEFQELREKVATGASKGELAPATARVNARLEEAKAANTALQQVIEYEQPQDVTLRARLLRAKPATHYRPPV